MVIVQGLLINREIKGKCENMMCYNDLTIISTPTKLFLMEKLTHIYNISNEKKNCMWQTQNIKRRENLPIFFTDFSGNDIKNALIPLFSTNNQSFLKNLMHPFYETATPDN